MLSLSKAGGIKELMNYLFTKFLLLNLNGSVHWHEKKIGSLLPSRSIPEKSLVDVGATNH
jgi:hypothetical protein